MASVPAPNPNPITLPQPSVPPEAIAASPTPTILGNSDAQAAPAPAAPAAIAPADAGMGVRIAPGEQLEDLEQVGHGYPTHLPPSATILFGVSATKAGAQTAVERGEASLRWAVERSEVYRLEMRGPDGRRAGSNGVLTDGGIAPLEAFEENGGISAHLRFDRHAGTLSSSLWTNSYRISDAALDSWSVLMQLAAIGRGNPRQLARPIVFLVGGAQGIATVRFEPAGKATIDTPMGPVQTEHMVQTVKPGATRMEVWLAPQYGWLPVQLRSSDANGRTLTHTAKNIALEDDPS